MRIFRGLENIHSVIDRHETEWRRENGEPELRTPDKIAESVRQRLAVQPDSKSGRFDESRFLGGKTKPAKKTESESSSKPEFTPSKPDEESVKFSADRFLGGNSEPVIPEESHEAVSEIMPDAESNEPEAVEIIPNKEGRHSWLYNEVMKAINAFPFSKAFRILLMDVLPSVTGDRRTILISSAGDRYHHVLFFAHGRSDFDSMGDRMGRFNGRDDPFCP